jgi:CO/xanthine dehydrogenase FAD-binding subunit
MAPVPYRVRDAEHLLVGRKFNAVNVSAASESWCRRAHPLEANEWKVQAATVLLERSIAAALQRSQAGGDLNQEDNHDC